jgi:chemotaxis protein MotB
MAETGTGGPPVAAPIIIYKKKKGHGGHHGGAWKVAYADFVTAMMALFIVLWLLNSSADVKKAVGGYFQDPAGVGKLVGSGLAGTGEALSVSKDDMPKLKEKLSQAIKKAPEFKTLDKQIEMIVTGEGLRIELIETDKGVFFESGRPSPTALGAGLIQMLAGELGKLPNHIVVEGHTDAKPFGAGIDYGNWELSVDRANAARRIMDRNGIAADHVDEVRGFADRKPRKLKVPDDPSNRRVSVIVKYREIEENKTKPGEAKAGEGKPGGTKPAAEHGEKAKEGHTEKKPAK